jgi:signal transduction histidine kinase
MELFTGLLASSDLRQQEEQWVMQIQSGLRLASATVNNILEFHAAGRLAMRPVEINELLQSVQALLAPLARRAGMRWEGNLFSEELWISGDRERLQQVFVNLALNAFRFASAGGILRVGSEASEDGSVSVWFADAGPGIAPEILQRLYEPGISSRAGGTGLGLALAKRIVELHNGSIEVSSSGGEGSRFDLRFQRLNPLHQAAAAPVVEMARSAGACA